MQRTHLLLAAGPQICFNIQQELMLSWETRPKGLAFWDCILARGSHRYYKDCEQAGNCLLPIFLWCQKLTGPAAFVT